VAGCEDPAGLPAMPLPGPAMRCILPGSSGLGTLYILGDIPSKMINPLSGHSASIDPHFGRNGPIVAPPLPLNPASSRLRETVGALRPGALRAVGTVLEKSADYVAERRLTGTERQQLSAVSIDAVIVR
jgi:hypothetical protein